MFSTCVSFFVAAVVVKFLTADTVTVTFRDVTEAFVTLSESLFRSICKMSWSLGV